MKKTTAHRLPFILLLVVHTCLVIFALYKNKDRKRLFILLLSNIGLAYLFEYLVFNVFQAYVYKPRFIKDKPLDNTFGAIMSQAIFVPFTAVFITALHLGWKIKISFALYFVVIEKIFIKFGIFKTYWWKTKYTAVLTFLYFFISDLWDKQLKREAPTVLFLSLFNILVVTNANILYVFTLIRKLRFGLGFFHTWWEHFAVVPLYSISYTFITILAKKKAGLVTSLLVLIFRMIYDWLLMINGFVKTRFPFGIVNLIFHLLMLFISTMFRQLVYGQSSNN